jgi:hypothetical protein
MILLISFLITVGISIFLGYQDGKKRKQEKLAFYKWQNQVLTQLEKISNKY